MTAPGNNTSDHPIAGHTDLRDERIARRARALYREASQRIDPTTAGRLRAARREALSAAKTPQHHTARWLVPTGAFAAIAFAMLMVWQPLSHGPSVPTSQPVSLEQSAEADSDLPPDAEKTDPNLYQNLDFYGWLAANSASDSQPANR
ncbi:hypothetical protein HDE76_002069 [Rhodanobacter sp. ANJX3]|uniref:DUF3619 family protein n=1 Tax=Rhodanobacter sp. ANJX3 TaxID=2723083 RepID=UPI001614EC34|nr:DUF3619 family protein [Rhodanobacter sp. ANJX3]MBB5358853.1 hypothetical protein [Rhodanobacter sp. ANJX3]